VPLSRFVRKTTACYALLFVLTWANGLFAIAQLGRIDGQSHDAIDGGLASTAVLGQLSGALNAYRAEEARELGPPGSSRAAEDRNGNRQRLQTNILRLARQYESLDSSDEQKRLFMKFLTAWYTYERQAKLTFDAISDKNSPRAAAAFGENGEVFDEASTALSGLIRITIEHGRFIEDDLHGIYRSSLWCLLAATATISTLIVVVVIASAWHGDRN
jgi:hypothetical protein